jgi:hypothetical protein
VAISALLEPTSGLLRSPVTKSAPSLVSPTVAHRCNSPSSPRAQAAQAPEPRTTSRIPMVRMSSVSVPDPGEKIRLGARIIVAPTATRAAATIAKIEVDAWAFSRITARPYSRSSLSRAATQSPTGPVVALVLMPAIGFVQIAQRHAEYPVCICGIDRIDGAGLAPEGDNCGDVEVRDANMKARKGEQRVDAAGVDANFFGCFPQGSTGGIAVGGLPGAARERDLTWMCRSV